MLENRVVNWKIIFQLLLNMMGACFAWINFVQCVGPVAQIDEWNNGWNVVHFPCNYRTYIKSNTSLLYSDFYLLISAETCFGLSYLPSSGSS